MELSFTKMNGAGNDFVVVDNRDRSLRLSRERIARLCNRQRGVGADGLLAVEPSEKGTDYRMRYYNADGGEAEMCGNGARCFAKFAKRLLGNQTEIVSFETIAGNIEAQFFGENVRIQLSEPFGLEIGKKLQIDSERFTVHSINTGVPHAVIFVEDLKGVRVRRLGAAIRYHEYFAPAGTNANFAEANRPGDISIRTYERGVEDETLACGTGMTACALIHHELTGCISPVRVTVRSGETLDVGFERDGEGRYRNVTLLGPAEFTFEGRLYL